MDAKLVYSILIIVGTFGTIGLAINAFFLKGIYDRLGTTEIAQATIFADGKAREQRIQRLEAEMMLRAKEEYKTRERLHSLEGGQKSLASFLGEGE